MLNLLVCVDASHPSQQFFSNAGTISCLPGFNKYEAEHNECLAQGHNTVIQASLKLGTLRPPV